MATEVKTFVDTDILIDVARKIPRAVDLWRRYEARSNMACSVVSAFELLAGCRNLREQRATVGSLATVEVTQIESGDSIEALQWYRSFHLSRGVGFLDRFIAAAARCLGCSVYTLNVKHFRAIPGLKVVSPY